MWWGVGEWVRIVIVGRAELVFAPYVNVITESSASSLTCFLHKSRLPVVNLLLFLAKTRERIVFGSEGPLNEAFGQGGHGGCQSSIHPVPDQLVERGSRQVRKRVVGKPVKSCGNLIGNSEGRPGHR